jgi:hypothetical protein
MPKEERGPSRPAETPPNHPSTNLDTKVPDQADRLAEARAAWLARKAGRVAVRRQFQTARDAGLRLRHARKLRRTWSR